MSVTRATLSIIDRNESPRNWAIIVNASTLFFSGLTVKYQSTFLLRVSSTRAVLLSPWCAIKFRHQINTQGNSKFLADECLRHSPATVGNENDRKRARPVTQSTYFLYFFFFQLTTNKTTEENYLPFYAILIVVKKEQPSASWMKYEVPVHDKTRVSLFCFFLSHDRE